MSFNLQTNEKFCIHTNAHTYTHMEIEGAQVEDEKYVVERLRVGKGKSYVLMVLKDSKITEQIQCAFCRNEPKIKTMILNRAKTSFHFKPRGKRIFLLKIMKERKMTSREKVCAVNNK